MQNKILIAIAIIVIFGFLFFAGKQASEKSPLQNGASVGLSAQAGVFELSESFFDFSTISMKEGKVSRMFSLRNTAESPITISTVTTSCMCTEAFVVHGDARHGPFGMPGHGSVPRVNETVEPGENVGIEIFFDPAAHGPAGVGKVERAVFIEDSDGNRSTIVIRAFVTP